MVISYEWRFIYCRHIHTVRQFKKTLNKVNDKHIKQRMTNLKRVGINCRYHVNKFKHVIDLMCFLGDLACLFVNKYNRTYVFIF